MKSHYKPASKLNSFGNKYKHTKTIVRMAIGVLVFLFLMTLLSSCTTKRTETLTIQTHCLDSVVTYQDLVECGVKGEL